MPGTVHTEAISDCIYSIVCIAFPVVVTRSQAILGRDLASP